MEPEDQRIGLFGGTFNPIHWGHLRAAEEIREFHHLQKVIFIPALYPPHKQGQRMLPPEYRLHMVKLATQSNPGFDVSDFEIRQTGPSYSIVTIEHFRKSFGSLMALYFIMGMDSFLEIGAWKDFSRLFALSNFVIMTRPGYPQKPLSEILPLDVATNFFYNAQEKSYTHRSQHKCFFQEITLLDIASSDIRSRVMSRKSIRYLVPPEVEHYIQEQRFYQE